MNEVNSRKCFSRRESKISLELASYKISFQFFCSTNLKLNFTNHFRYKLDTSKSRDNYVNKSSRKCHFIKGNLLGNQIRNDHVRAKLHLFRHAVKQPIQILHTIHLSSGARRSEGIPLPDDAYVRCSSKPPTRSSDHLERKPSNTVSLVRVGHERICI